MWKVLEPNIKPGQVNLNVNMVKISSTVTIRTPILSITKSNIFKKITFNYIYMAPIMKIGALFDKFIQGEFPNRLCWLTR